MGTSPGIESEIRVIDGHNDLAAELRKRTGYSVEGLDTERDELQTDLVKLQRGHVGAQFWSVWVPSSMPESVAATLEQVDAVYRLVSRYPDSLEFASTASEVERVMATGRIASLMGLEGGHAIAESLGVLRSYARLGVRYLTLTHDDDTSWAASATGLRQTTGLTLMGRAIVAEMNRIGMIVDLSHTAESTQRDVLNVTMAPVIFSHSSSRAITEHPRNVSDEILARLPSNGGVVQITFVPEFVSQRCADWENALQALQRELGLPSGSHGTHEFAAAPKPGQSAESALRQHRLLPTAEARLEDETREALALWLAENPMPQAEVQDVADHLDHARDVAGIDHIGIGGDYGGTAVFPARLENASSYPTLFEELISRGWSTGDLRKLASLNVLRAMRAVEDAATEPMWPARPATR
jgi:membrane dipeptidase